VLRLERVLAVVEDRLAQDITVREMATVAFLSPFHFSRCFRQAVGMPPHRYLRTQRVERAKGLLSTTDIPLREIARIVGYRTQAHFTHVFRNTAGVTPGAFRQAMRNTASVSLGGAREAGSRPELARERIDARVEGARDLA
jgi:AraC family transcriptional regulator